MLFFCRLYPTLLQLLRHYCPPCLYAFAWIGHKHELKFTLHECVLGRNGHVRIEQSHVVTLHYIIINVFSERLELYDW